MDKIAKLLEKLKEDYQADGVKIYFNDEENYTCKIIKDGKVIDSIRKRTDNKLKAWDIKGCYDDFIRGLLFNGIKIENVSDILSSAFNLEKDKAQKIVKKYSDKFLKK